VRRICGLLGIVIAAAIAGPAGALDGVPTVPVPTVPTPTVPTPTVPKTTVPTPTVPAPTVPTPTVPKTTVPTPTVPKTTVPTPTVPKTTVPTPTVPKTTVPAPTVPRTTVPTPTVRTPTVPRTSLPAPTVPSVTLPPPTVSAPHALAPVSSRVASTGTAVRAGSAHATAHAAAPPGAPVQSPVQSVVSAAPQGVAATTLHVSSSARKRSRTQSRRPLVIRFRIRHGVTVTVLVHELAPMCRMVGRYRLAARPGTNVVRLPRRVAGRHLGAGTYALVGRRPGGKKLFDVVARVARGHDHRLHVRTLQRHHPHVSCTSTTSLSAAAGTGLATQAPVTSEAAFRPPRLDRATIASSEHVAGSPLVSAISLQDAPAPLRPWLYALLALSIGLLSAAAMPAAVLRAGPTAAFIAERRAYLAAAGIALLALVAVITSLA
jgi:hypothetical protein